MPRKDISLTPDQVRELITTERTLQVATIGRDGVPHLAPMWFLPHGDSVAFRSFTKSQKIVNLQRDPRLTVLLERGQRYEELQGVMIRGTAELVTDRGRVLQAYAEIAVRYDFPAGMAEAGELDGVALEAAFGRFAAKNTLVVVRPDHIASWDHTKLGGSY